MITQTINVFMFAAFACIVLFAMAKVASAVVVNNENWAQGVARKATTVVTVTAGGALFVTSLVLVGLVICNCAAAISI